MSIVTIFSVVTISCTTFFVNNFMTESICIAITIATGFVGRGTGLTHQLTMTCSYA